MKTKKLLSLLAFAILCFGHPRADAQGTAFTYQGRLNTSGAPATGLYDFEFSLFNAASGGTQIGSTVSQTGLAVSNGLFATTMDFGAAFTGNATWLAIAVRTNGEGTYTALAPLQELTPTPYAIFATTANQVQGPVSLAQLPAVVSSLNDPGTLNFFAGQSAGDSSLTGTDNTAVGDNSLSAVSSGSGNTAAGQAALNLDTTGANNAAFGAFALVANKGGSDNVAVGYDSSLLNSTGSNNTATGYAALEANTTGSDNTADGYEALGGTTAGTEAANTATGGYTIFEITTGYNNTAAGYEALYGNSTGVDNVGIGVATFYGNSTGSLNTAVGTYAFQSMSVGAQNIGLGYKAGGTLTSGSNNIYIGNSGASSENGVTRIGTAGTQTTTYIAGNVGLGGATPQQVLSLNGGMNIDQSGQNIGTPANALTFGNSSGEGIGSIRTSGDSDSYGLDFYTDFNNRMTITQGGNVGIGTTNPVAQLDLNASSASSAALNIVQGGIKVTGAGYNTQTAVFIQIVTDQNLYAGSSTQINNSLCNGNPDAMLFITHNHSASSNTGNFTDSVSVNYLADEGYWYIYDENDNDLPAGLAFNVMVVVP